MNESRSTTPHRHHQPLNISLHTRCCIEQTLAPLQNMNTKSLETMNKLLAPCLPDSENRVLSSHGNKTNMLKDNLFGSIILTLVPSSEISTNHENTDHCQKYLCETPINQNMYPYITLLIATLLIATIGNIFVCSIITKIRSLRQHPTYKLLKSLAVSDLLVSLLVLPIKISMALTNNHFCSSINICRLYQTVDHVFFTASITHLFVIAIDRYLTISRPFNYRFAEKHYRMMICVVWIYAALWGVLSNVDFETYQFQSTFHIDHGKCQRKDIIFPRVLFIAVFFLPCLVMFYMHACVWKIAVDQGKKIEKENTPTLQFKRLTGVENSEKSSKQLLPKYLKQFSNSSSGKFKVEFRATKIILSVFGTYLICWAPVTIMTFMRTFRTFNIDKNAYLFLCSFLPNLNSCLNPFLYCLLHRDFINALKTVYRRLKFVSKHEMSIKHRANTGEIIRTRKANTR
ncbi:histamine H2 receptor-like [Clytia hemisphaerica]